MRQLRARWTLWEAAEALREIGELYGPEEPVSTIVDVPSTFLGPAGALCRNFSLPARSQAPGRQASTPSILSAFCTPTSFPKLPGTESLHRSCYLTRTLSVQQTGERRLSLWDCRGAHCLCPSPPPWGGQGLYPGARSRQHIPNT